MNAINKVMDRLSKYGFWLSTAGICFVTLLISFDIIFRLFGYPILGSYEIVEIAMSIVVFWAFAYTQRKKGNVNVTMFLKLLPPKVRMTCYAFTSILSVVMIGFVTYAAFNYAGIVMEKQSATGILDIPFYPFYYIEGVAMALLTIVLLFDAINTLRALFNREIAQEIEKYWI